MLLYVLHSVNVEVVVLGGGGGGGGGGRITLLQPEFIMSVVVNVMNVN